MWNVLEPWQLGQLQRLASLDSERAETILNTLWKSYPGLFEEMAISAVDHEVLSVDECASRLKNTAAEVEAMLLRFRQRSLRIDRAVVFHEGSSIARLHESQLSVWEIIREFRKLGSVERLEETFPSVPRIELAAALTYAEEHPKEIEDQILMYEEAVMKRRAEYPFAR